MGLQTRKLQAGGVKLLPLLSVPGGASSGRAKAAVTTCQTCELRASEKLGPSPFIALKRHYRFFGNSLSNFPQSIRLDPKVGLLTRSQALERKEHLTPKTIALGPNPLTYELWALGQASQPFEASVFSSMNWDKYTCLFILSLRGLKPNQSYFNVDAIKNYKMLGDIIFEVTLKEQRDFCRWRNVAVP